jgi:thiosulfate sulfurtransferase
MINQLESYIVTQLKHLTPADLKAKMQAGAYVLDIRDANSYNAAHIKGSTHMDSNKLSDFLMLANKDKPVVVCCYSGISSQQLATLLINQGFDDVYNLEGGFTAIRTSQPELCA